MVVAMQVITFALMCVTAKGQQCIDFVTFDGNFKSNVPRLPWEFCTKNCEFIRDSDCGSSNQYAPCHAMPAEGDFGFLYRVNGVTEDQCRQLCVDWETECPNVCNGESDPKEWSSSCNPTFKTYDDWSCQHGTVTTSSCRTWDKKYQRCGPNSAWPFQTQGGLPLNENWVNNPCTKRCGGYVFDASRDANPVCMDQNVKTVDQCTLLPVSPVRQMDLLEPSDDPSIKYHNCVEGHKFSCPNKEVVFEFDPWASNTEQAGCATDAQATTQDWDAMCNDPNAEYSCFPGYDLIGRGFDITSESLMQRALELTFSGDRYKKVNGEFYLFPQEIDMITLVETTDTAESKEYTAGSELAQNVAANLGVDKGVASFKGETAASRQQKFSEGKSVFETFKQQLFGTVSVSQSDKKCSSTFLQDVASLPDSFEAGKFEVIWKPFISKFGTHFVNKGQLGGKISGEQTSAACEESSAMEVSAAFEGDIKAKGVSGGGSASHSESGESATSIDRSSLKAEGGNPIVFKDEGWAAWAATLSDSEGWPPALINQQVAPLWWLVHDNKKRMALRNAVNHYIQSESETHKDFFCTEKATASCDGKTTLDADISGGQRVHTNVMLTEALLLAVFTFSWLQGV